MTSNAGEGRGLARSLVLVLGIAVLLGLAGALVGMRAFAAQAPPEELSNEELLSRVARATGDPPAFSASLTVEQSVIPAQLLEAAGQGSGFAASGPQSARVWYGGPDKLTRRAAGRERRQDLRPQWREGLGVQRRHQHPQDRRASPGATASETARHRGPADPRGGRQDAGRARPDERADPGEPIAYAGREAYVLDAQPQRRGLDARGSRTRPHRLRDLPAAASSPYTPRAKPDPVFSWRVSGLDVGPVPAERFDFQAPPGARVIPFEQGQEERREPGMRAKAPSPRK